MDFQKDFEEIRNIRQNKYSKSNTTILTNKPVYNYENRKDIIAYVKKCTKFEQIKEKMNSNEKNDYKNKISKICLDDLDYFSESEINLNFMIDLFKYNFNLDVLEKSYQKYLSTPHISMIKELISKPKISEEFLLKLIYDYTKTNKNYINLLVTTNILETKFISGINYILNLIYSDQNISLTFEQIKLICSKTNITPDQFEFLILRCSNVSAFSKCPKTFVEKPNIDLIKNLIREIEHKTKSKISIDLYSLQNLHGL